MSLFQLGKVVLASGRTSEYKIDCDALADADWSFFAWYIARHTYPFATVEGVPTGGLKLAERLRAYASPRGGLLIVDDVFTTGGSLYRHVSGRECQKAVAFCRGRAPEGVVAVFEMPGEGARA